MTSNTATITSGTISGNIISSQWYSTGTILNNTQTYLEPTSIYFHDENGEEVGKLTWENGQFIFKGELEPSAEAFMNEIGRRMAQAVRNKE